MLPRKGETNTKNETLTLNLCIHQQRNFNNNNLYKKSYMNIKIKKVIKFKNYKLSNIESSYNFSD